MISLAFRNAVQSLRSSESERDPEADLTSCSGANEAEQLLRRPMNIIKDSAFRWNSKFFPHVWTLTLGVSWPAGHWLVDRGTAIRRAVIMVPLGVETSDFINTLADKAVHREVHFTHWQAGKVTNELGFLACCSIAILATFHHGTWLRWSDWNNSEGPNLNLNTFK